MIQIGNDLVEALKKVNVPGLKVCDAYDVTAMTPPLITLYEQPGPGVLYPDGKPVIVRNLFQLEVYCRQGRIDGAVRSAGACARLLMEKAAAVMEGFGLTQQGEMAFAPYINDTTIMRGVARYTGVIDTKTEIIYRE